MDRSFLPVAEDRILDRMTGIEEAKVVELFAHPRPSGHHFAAIQEPGKVEVPVLIQPLSQRRDVIDQIQARPHEAERARRGVQLVPLKRPIGGGW